MDPSSEYGRPGGELERGAFFALMSAFATGVAVVTTLDGDEPRGLATNAFTSVSADPPLLLVCLDRTARTLPAVLATGRFAVNFLAEGRDETARVFASKDDHKFAAIAWEPGGNGMPVLREDAIGHAECTIERELEIGDHVVVVGRVVAGRPPDGRPPLLYFRRSYGRFAPAGGAA